MGVRFQQNIVDAAQRLKDNRTNASSAFDAGMRYSSAKLVTYENQAIRDTIRGVFEKAGRDEFVKSMPEMVKQSSSLVSVGSGVFTKPTDAWTFIEVYDVTDGRIAKRIDSDLLKTLNSLDPLILPSAARPIYWEEATQITIYPMSCSAANGRYIFIHPTIAVSDTSDVLISQYYDGEIVERMVQTALHDTYLETPKP